jgi:nucleoside-diphosphate-sugar epimerase
MMDFDYKYNTANIDLHDKLLPKKLPADIDTIFFLAADPRIYYYRTRPVECFRNNFELILNILECKYRKFIFVSTVCVYKNLDNFSLDPALGWNDESGYYGMAKLLAEKEVELKADDFCILRMSTPYFGRMSKGPLYDILFQNQSFVDLKSEYSFIHVEDAARAITHCYHENLSGVYNLTDVDSISLRKLFDWKRNIKCLGNTKYMYDSNNEKLRKSGWKQKFSVVDFVDQYKDSL